MYLLACHLSVKNNTAIEPDARKIMCRSFENFIQPFFSKQHLGFKNSFKKTVCLFLGF